MLKMIERVLIFLNVMFNTRKPRFTSNTLMGWCLKCRSSVLFKVVNT